MRFTNKQAAALRSTNERTATLRSANERAVALRSNNERVAALRSNNELAGWARGAGLGCGYFFPPPPLSDWNDGLDLLVR